MEANTEHHLRLSCLFTPLHCRIVKAFAMLWATRSSKKVGTVQHFSGLFVQTSLFPWSI